MMWKKFGFSVARKVMEAVKEDLVPHTENKWDDAAVDGVELLLDILEKKFITDVEVVVPEIVEPV